MRLNVKINVYENYESMYNVPTMHLIKLAQKKKYFLKETNEIK